MTEHKDLPPSEWHGSASITGSGSPVGSVTPQAVGEFFFDSAGPALYIATGLTNADWVNVTTGTAGGSAKAVALPQFFDRDNNNSFDRALRHVDDNSDGESVKSGWNSGSGGYFVVPFANAVLTAATLSVRGIAVSPGSVTFPLTFRFGLFSQDVSGETRLGDIDFVIPSAGAPPIGTFNNSGGTNTNLRGATASPNIALTQGDLIGLRYDFDTNGARVNAARHAIVVLRVEEQ